MSSTFMSIEGALGEEQLEKLELVLKLINNTNLTLYTSVTIQGDIRINGQTAESTIMRQISSFMYQDDIFIETMTVFELMWFTAKLRLEYKMDNSSLEKTINDILQEVGLLSRKNHKIGATEHTKILSGGEKKRLSFAAELISNPMVLFLDEPTTGQDAFTANILIKYLKKLTMKNRTILCTLHQPSSELFNYFDNVIIIADGRVAFFGTNLEAMKFFAGCHTFSCHRTLLLIQRGFLQIYRSSSIRWLQILQKIMIAIISGLCFFGSINLDQLGIQATQGVIFILVSENTFFPMYSTLSLIPQELPLFLREYKTGMFSVKEYYISKVLTLFPGLVIESVIFTFIVCILSGLVPQIISLLETIMIVILTINVSSACGFFFSVAFKNISLAMAYLVPFDYILMITMGSFIKLSSLPLYIQWVKYFSWLLYSTETISIIHWKDINNISCYPNDEDLPCIEDGNQVLQYFDFQEDNFTQDIIFMISLYFMFHFLGYIILLKKSS
ncbi:protein scarlet [Trichogramma pretiosum]|uniref:protein scarlet n=1 Tax=Trichogramma pretiosum TaxID=7493 RepID=UPI000C718BCB|nr:protein scarlet [Trichogramma pretiosum]